MRFLKEISIVSLICSVHFMSAGVARAEQTLNQSETTSKREFSDPDRFARRVILTGGVVNTGYDGESTARMNDANGFSAGILADLAGHNRLVLETGLLYRQVGTRLGNTFADSNLSANYFSIPVAAKYYFNGQEFTSVYVKAGVMGSRLVSNPNAYTAYGSSQLWEGAGLVGAGLKLNLTASTDVIFEANYNRAFTSVFANSNIYRSDLSGALGLAMNL